MILPTKHGRVGRSLIAIGAMVVSEVTTPKRLDEVFEELRSKRLIRSYEQYYRAVLLAYMLGALELEGGRLTRVGEP